MVIANAQLEQLVIDYHGCCLLRNVFSPNTIATLAEEISDSLGSENSCLVRHRSQTLGARNLAATWDGWRTVVSCKPIKQLLCRYVGESFGLVRILYFDKPPGDGWSLPWHRDQTIAVRQHFVPLNPFSKPTIKTRVPHVEATREVLQQMLTLRLSLDPMTADNGPLLFVPGSHNDLDDAIAPQNNISPIDKTIVELQCEAGDVFAMRPLILHASRKSNDAANIHRRVIHMEFAPKDILPEPWQWHSFKPTQ